MPSRNKTLENVAKMMQREAKAQLESGIGKWNGLTILAVPEWRKILFGKNPAYAAKFIPDDYTEDSIILSIFLRDEKFGYWRKNWLEFLLDKKNPAVGRQCCSGCILNCELGPIGKYVVKSLGLDHRCHTVNAFCCPIERFSVEYLVFVGKACNIIEQVLLYPAKQAMYDSLKTFRVDFTSGKVLCFDYPGDVHPSEDTIQNQLPKSTFIPLSGPDDYSRAISDVQLFSGLFDQYCNFVENGSRYYGRIVKCKDEADKIRELKGKITSFLKKLGTIEPGVFAELHQSFVEYDRDERQRLEEHKKMQIAAAPEIFGPIINSDRNGACDLCREFANIQCTNCSIWICSKHWQDHWINEGDF